MTPVNLQIPGNLVDKLKLPPGRAQEELRREFAVFLVKEGLLTRSQARQIAEMDRLDFEALLARRRVEWEGTPDDVLLDFQAAKTAANR